MLQSISEYWKLDENLIVNDFDKPYIVLVFASLHLMDTTSGSILRSISILSHLVLLFFGRWCIHFDILGKNQQLQCLEICSQETQR